MLSPATPATHAFLEVLSATQDRLRSYVAGMGVGLDDVDDITQEVYLIYFRDGHHRPPDVAPLHWLRGIARKRCQDYFRVRGRRSRHLQALSRALEACDSPLDAPGDERARLAALAGCIERLTPRHREMLRWYYEEERSAEEVGRFLARSAGAVRVAMVRLRDVLRRCLLEATTEQA